MEAIMELHCKYCNSPDLIQYGTCWRGIDWDKPFQERTTTKKHKIPRYRCNSCGKTTNRPIEVQ